MKQNTHGSFYGLLLLLLALIFVRYVLQVAFPEFVLLGVAMLMACIGDRDEIVAVCVFSIPLYTSYSYAYVVLFSVLMYVLKFHEDIRINLSFVPIILMICWELLHCFDEVFSIRLFVMFVVPYLLMLVLMCRADADWDYRFQIHVLAIATAGMGVVLLGKVLAASGFNVQAAFTNMGRLGLAPEGTQNVGAAINPNTYGIICSLAIAGLLQLRKKNRGSSPFERVLLVWLMLTGALTMSRTYLVCLLLVLGLYVLVQEGTMKKKLLTVFCMLMLIAVLILILQLLVPSVVSAYYKRFLSSDITSGRDSLFMKYHRVFLSSAKSMFFGVGLQQFYEKTVEAMQIINMPHNGFQEILIAWGIPGFIMFLCFLGSLLVRAGKQNRRITLMSAIPLILWLVKVQAGQLITSDYTMLGFAVVYLSLCCHFEEEPPEQAENSIVNCSS